MARVIYSSEALADLERIIDFLLVASPENAGAALAQIESAALILRAHPRIGRRVDGPRRELVISHGSAGYLALYRYDPRADLVPVLRIRHQREAGYLD